MKKVVNTKNFKNIKRFYNVKHSDHILYKNRKGEIRYLSDYEILKNSTYPAEYPSTHIPIEDTEVTSHKGRRALDWLYKQYKEQCI
jgi:hypothetical protein